MDHIVAHKIRNFKRYAYVVALTHSKCSRTPELGTGRASTRKRREQKYNRRKYDAICTVPLSPTVITFILCVIHSCNCREGVEVPLKTVKTRFLERSGSTLLADWPFSVSDAGRLYGGAKVYYSLFIYWRKRRLVFQNQMFKNENGSKWGSKFQRTKLNYYRPISAAMAKATGRLPSLRSPMFSASHNFLLVSERIEV